MAPEHTSPLSDEHEEARDRPTFAASEVEAHERRLGRYELFYEIGHGGMANVFLARARGPAGFQKWFAIKRVHSQLAKNRGFVNMFLDEARIAAAIQHPNVAQVFDLGEADGRYFLAMEYLHGEPLTSVATRSALENGRMPLGTAAYVVARAADGLHHAHEATDATGKSMNLVHRDVSPHNIFVTYDGQVKLTDFGVAKAAGRITNTDTGVVKGKLAYASPEQLRGDPLDRRSDIFALGVVLWEIATGRRLFRGSSDAETLHRIYSGYRLSPTSLVAGFPGELERIIDRALAHEVDDRYPTAAELARDLDRFLATSDLPSGSTELARNMNALFEAQMKAKNAVLHKLHADPEAAELEPDEPPTEEPSESRLRRLGTRSQGTPPNLEARRGPRGRLVMGLLLLLLLLALTGGLTYRQLTHPQASRVRVDTTPAGAAVEIDGEAVRGRTPLLVESVAEGSHVITLRLDGHEDLEAAFEAHGDRVELHYSLSASSNTGTIDEPLALPAPQARSASSTDHGEGAAAPPPTPPNTGADDPERTDNADEPSRVVLDERRSPARRRGVRRRGARAAPSEPAYLSLVARPWARVWINGEEAGDTPIYRRRVPPGVIRVRLQREGQGLPREYEFRAGSGETVSRNILLD